MSLGPLFCPHWTFTMRRPWRTLPSWTCQWLDPRWWAWSLSRPCWTRQTTTSARKASSSSRKTRRCCWPSTGWAWLLYLPSIPSEQTERTPELLCLHVEFLIALLAQCAYVAQWFSSLFCPFTLWRDGRIQCSPLKKEGKEKEQKSSYSTYFLIIPRQKSGHLLRNCRHFSLFLYHLTDAVV